MKKLPLIIVVLINLILILPGCVPSKPTDEVEILPSERLINKLEVNRRRIKSFEGSGTISVRASGINQSASFRVVLQKPDSLYLTIMGPFGIELAQAVVTDENFIFYDALQNTAYRGELDDDILRQIFKIDLSFSQLMDAFIGSVNLTGNLYQQPDEYNIDYDKYVLTYIDPDYGQKTVYRVDIRQLGITDYYIFDDDGYVLLEGKYSNFDFFETVAVPYKVEIQNKEENQRIVIDYKNISVNKSGITINFKLPDDATIIKW